MQLTLATLGLAGLTSAVNQGHRSSGKPWHAVITEPTGVELVGERPLPLAFDWRDVDGRSYVTPMTNQHIPTYCGACWIHGTAAALNDRIKIMRHAQAPDVMLSRQAMVNCVEDDDGANPGCDGGEPYFIYRHMRESPLPDETCGPYVAHNQQCTPENVCMNCLPTNPDVQPENPPVAPGACFAVNNFVGYSVGDSGAVSGELDIQKEIYARGPITCEMETPSHFLYQYAEIVALNDGVWSSDDVTNTSNIDHDVSVTGWGETEDGLKYWLVRNSWGTYWGDGGWFKIRRGDSHLSIEHNCSWAVPEFAELDRAKHGKIMGDYILGLTPLASPVESSQAPLLAVERAPTPVPSQPAPVAVALLSGVAGAVAAATGLLAFSGRRQLQQPTLLG